MTHSRCVIVIALPKILDLLKGGDFVHLDFGAIMAYVFPFIAGFLTKWAHGEFTKKD